MKKQYTLVLGGGGAKGSYQIGAWKALRELHIKFNSVVGTSVGALNGALIIQDYYKEAENMWRNIGIKDIINIPDEFIDNENISINRKSFHFLKKMQEDFFKKKGLDTTPLRKLIKKFLDEKKIRRSKRDFGIVTYELDSLKPLTIFIDEIPVEHLTDYLVASSSIPGFQPAMIKGKKYFDGGLYDNVPFNIAKNRGYKNIIVIDVSGWGLNKKAQIEGTDTIYIKNSINIGSVLDFGHEKIRSNFKLGYLDTLKTFGKIDGLNYFYKFNKKLSDKLFAILTAQSTYEEYEMYLNKGTNFQNVIANIKSILPQEVRVFPNIVQILLEYAAKSLKIEQNKLYSFEEFVNSIWNKFNELEAISPKNNSGLLHLVTTNLEDPKKNQNNFFKNIFSKSPYEYDKILSIVLIHLKKNPLLTKVLSNIFPELIASKIIYEVLKHYFKTK